jgi:hypothetical protein
VYPLPKLFYELRNACVSGRSGAVGFPVFSLAEHELEKDVFNFTKGISCEVGVFKSLVQKLNPNDWHKIVQSCSCAIQYIQTLHGCQLLRRNISLVICQTPCI